MHVQRTGSEEVLYSNACGCAVIIRVVCVCVCACVCVRVRVCVCVCVCVCCALDVQIHLPNTYTCIRLCEPTRGHVHVLCVSLILCGQREIQVSATGTQAKLGSGGIKKDKLIKDQGFCQTGKLYYPIVLNYRKMNVSV